MQISFSGHLGQEEQVEATRLLTWSSLEAAVILVILGLGAGAGIVFPWWQGQSINALPIAVSVVVVAALVAGQLYRRSLVRKAVAERVEGVWEGDALSRSGAGSSSLPLHLSPKNLRDCQVGRDTLIIWSGNVPTVLSASLFKDRLEWTRLRTLIEELCSGPLRRRKLVLVGSVIAWFAILAIAWAAWGSWLR